MIYSDVCPGTPFQNNCFSDMKPILFLLALSFLLFDCEGNQSDTSNTTRLYSSESDPPNANPATPNSSTAGTAYPPLPQEQLNGLFTRCDYIDYIFYKANFSMNQSNPSAIQATISGISAEGATVFPGCTPVGHVFFQAKGQILAEADLYLEGNCTFYLFTENQQPAYANLMTAQGLSYYANLFRQLDNAN